MKTKPSRFDEGYTSDKKPDEDEKVSGKATVTSKEECKAGVKPVPAHHLTDKVAPIPNKDVTKTKMKVTERAVHSLVVIVPNGYSQDEMEKDLDNIGVSKKNEKLEVYEHDFGDTETFFMGGVLDYDAGDTDDHGSNPPIDVDVMDLTIRSRDEPTNEVTKICDITKPRSN